MAPKKKSLALPISRSPTLPVFQSQGFRSKVMHTIVLNEIYGAEKNFSRSPSLQVSVSGSPGSQNKNKHTMERKTMEWKTAKWKTMEDYGQKTMDLWKTTTKYEIVQLPQTPTLALVMSVYGEKRV
jgi:hypothetical protein